LTVVIEVHVIDSVSAVPAFRALSASAMKPCKALI